MKVLPSRRIGRVVVTYTGISGKDYCTIGLGPKFIAAYPKHLENGEFTQVTVSSSFKSVNCLWGLYSWIPRSFSEIVVFNLDVIPENFVTPSHDFAYLLVVNPSGGKSVPRWQNNMLRYNRGHEDDLPVHSGQSRPIGSLQTSLIFLIFLCVFLRLDGYR